MNDLIEVCDRARGELRLRGDLGVGLVDVVDLVEVVANGRGLTALGDPAFALEVLSSLDGRADAAAVGRVLDFLRSKAGATGLPVTRVVTVTEAVAAYERGAPALMADGTVRTYRTWIRRLSPRLATPMSRW